MNSVDFDEFFRQRPSNCCSHFICRSCGKRVERGIISITAHPCGSKHLEEIFEEDADFEVIEPLKIEDKK